MLFRSSLFLITALAVAPAIIRAQSVAPFPIEPGERVVLLGNALIEHERIHGFLETRLRRHAPTTKLFVRNLGWAGDTVRGDARSSGYQNPEGLPRLLKEVKEMAPTIIVVGYGTPESFAGIEGLDGFLKGYQKLLGDLSGLKAKIVILSPTWHEDLGRPLPDPAEHNRSIEAYASSLKSLATERGIRFVDLTKPLAAAKTSPQPLTSNGILLNELGYWHMAAAVEKQLGFNAADDRVAFRFEGKSITPTLLIAPPLPGSTTSNANLAIRGLPAGRHSFTLSGVVAATASDADWDKGVRVSAGPFVEDIEALRKAIVTRNDLFFRGWRPFNDHSRHWGFMAKDFKLFAEMVQRQDDVIDGLRIGRVTSLAVVPEKSK